MSCFRPFSKSSQRRAADQEAAHTRSLLELLAREARLKQEAQSALHYSLTRNAVLVRTVGAHDDLCGVAACRHAAPC